MEGLTAALGAQPDALAAAVVLDLLLGDPVYRFHPVRLMGGSLSLIEKGLRRIGADGYGGGIALFIILALLWVVIVALAQLGFAAVGAWPAWLFHVFIVYSLLAFGDLFRHVWRVERALERGDLAAARTAIGRLVGRDTDRMDEGACRRSAIESMSEGLPDGYVSAIFWYVLLGLPGLVVFKVVSTMDSMVGYKTPRYMRFGWCGARLDDAMNLIPARIELASHRAERGRGAPMFARQSARDRLSPSGLAAEPELRLAGSSDRRCHSAAAGRPHLERRPTRDRHLDRRSQRSARIGTCRPRARDGARSSSRA